MSDSQEGREPPKPGSSAAESLSALEAYHDFLGYLSWKGRAENSQGLTIPTVPFLQEVVGLPQLFATLSAVAPAPPDTGEEEWNPLSQRPHAPLLPSMGDELGIEITALKSAVEQFTILSHETMHIALWEPFFAGRWHPEDKASFAEFSLLAEGYCHYFADIIVSRRVRVSLADGEFALERQTPSSALFHPYRAFAVQGIHDPREILAIYLQGFSGGRTSFWQNRGENPWATTLAAQAYNFYQGSLSLLDDVYAVFQKLAVFREFYRRFCCIPDLPSFLPHDLHPDPQKLPDFFFGFQDRALPHLATLPATNIEQIAFRRMLQMRAYYATQVRWIIAQNHLIGKGMTQALRSRWLSSVDSYLDSLEDLLHKLTQSSWNEIGPRLSLLDKAYTRELRLSFLKHQAWTSLRWFLAPKRAGGFIDVGKGKKTSAVKRKLIETSQYFIEELNPLLETQDSPSKKAELLGLMSTIAQLGARAGIKDPEVQEKAWRQLLKKISDSDVLPLWSLPLASMDPEANTFRELLFSYQ